jgi:Zn-dependent protease with chaperone function
MFALRGIAVSLTFFAVLYCLLSLLVALTWRSLRLLHPQPERIVANLLFALRVLPVAASTLITLGFVVPSFQLLEPRSIEEGVGAMPLVLGLCALPLIACALFRVVTAQVRTARVIAGWVDGANPLIAETEAVTFRTTHDVPPLTLVGVRKPRVLVSESAVALLSREELHIALKHEIAHLRSRDNLKKLVFRFSPFPGMAGLESAWSQAAELAADDAAALNLNDAVDLAAALVKLSRLVPVEVAPACTVGLVTGSIHTRVSCLLAWDEASRSTEIRRHRWYAVLPALAVAMLVIATYSNALALIHEITEWLVR